MMKTKVGIIGNSKMAIDCIHHLLTLGDIEIVWVMYDEKQETSTTSLYNFCQSKGLSAYYFKNINSEEAFSLYERVQLDWILSINNYKIIKSPLINLPSQGILNFHNGPLPLYGGVNTPSWALINGEKKYGCTWHFVDEQIDKGDIVLQSIFDIEPEMNATLLMAKCIIEGVQLFKNNIHKVLLGDYNRKSQKNSLSSYFSLKNMPDNQGVIKWNWEYEKIENMVRGLNFLPLTNTFIYAKMKHKEKFVILNEVERVGAILDTNIVPGTIVSINKNTFYIACKDAIVNIVDSMDDAFDNYSCLELADYLEVKEKDVIE